MSDEKKLLFELEGGFKVFDEEQLSDIETLFICTQKPDYLLGYLLYEDPEAFVQVLYKLDIVAYDHLILLYDIYKDVDLLDCSLNYPISGERWSTINCDKLHNYWIKTAYELTEKFKITGKFDFDDMVNFTELVKTIFFIDNYFKLLNLNKKS